MNCEFFDNENFIVEFNSKEFEITQKSLKNVNYFIEKLAISKTKETLHGNAGKIFGVINSDSTIEKLKQEAPYEVVLRVDKVPEELRAVKQYNMLELRFTDKVEIPDWMDSMDITKLVIEGKLTADEKKDLEQRFGKRIVFKDKQKHN